MVDPSGLGEEGFPDDKFDDDTLVANDGTWSKETKLLIKPCIGKGLLFSNKFQSIC